MECTPLHGSQLSQSDSVELVLPETRLFVSRVSGESNGERDDRTNERDEPVWFVRSKDSFNRTCSRTNEPTLPRIQYLTFRGAHFEMLNETRACVRNDSNTAPKNNRKC